MNGWRIRTLLGNFVVSSRSDFEPSAGIEFNPFSVEDEIGLWAHDPIIRPSLFEMYEAVYGHEVADSLRVDTAWLTQRIRDAFRRGDLVLTRTEGQPVDSDRPAEVEEEEEPGPVAPEELTWFRARLRDEDGVLMAGEDYVLVDSAGTRKEGKLDANGEVYIPSILPYGDCTISFPNVHLNPRKKK